MDALAGVFPFVPQLRFNITPPSTTDGRLVDWQGTTDGSGKVFLTGGSLGVPVAGYSRTSATALVKEKVFANVPAQLIEFWGSIAGGPLYLFVFDSTTAPADGATNPREVFTVSDGEFSFQPRDALPFAVGIAVVVSIDPVTLARPVHDVLRMTCVLGAA